MRLVLATAAVLGVALVSTSGSVALAAEQNTNAPAQQVAKEITVNPGDYLAKIATENQSTIQRLYDKNTDVQDPDLIFPGQKLKVPAPDEQLAHREMPSNVVAAVPAPAPKAAPARTTARTVSTAPSVANGSVWDRLAQCEASGNWHINTGNGYYGGLQFTLSSWRAAGGSGYPHQASREEQILRGQKLQAMQGWGAWPACSAKLGLR